LRANVTISFFFCENVLEKLNFFDGIFVLCGGKKNRENNFIPLKQAAIK
jgi:hypothetical protein